MLLDIMTQSGKHVDRQKGDEETVGVRNKGFFLCDSSGRYQREMPRRKGKVSGAG